MPAGNLASSTFMSWAYVLKNILAITIWADNANSAIRPFFGALVFPALANVMSRIARDFTRLRSDPCAYLPILPAMFESLFFPHDDRPRSAGR